MSDSSGNQEPSLNLHLEQTASFNQLLQLKNAERQLIDKLNTTEDETLKTSILSQINQISQLKQQVYQSVYSMPIEDSSGADLSNIDAAVQDMVQRTTQQLSDAEDVKNNAIRSGEITDYYKKSYAAYLKIMYIVCGALGIIFIMRLFNYMIPIIPDFLQSIVVIVVLAAMIIWVGMEANDINRRDNRFYDKYDFGASVKTVGNGSGSGSGSGGADFNMNKYLKDTYNSGACVGEACCPPGTSYDSSNNICQLPGASGAATGAAGVGEGFTLLGDVNGDFLDLSPANSNVGIMMSSSALHAKSAEMNRINGPIEYMGIGCGGNSKMQFAELN